MFTGDIDRLFGIASKSGFYLFIYYDIEVVLEKNN